MTERAGADNRPKADRSSPRARLDDLASRAGLVLWWERIWPLLWLPLTVVLVFLSLSWLGIWLEATPLLRQIGVGAFTLALLASLAPLLSLRRPGRMAALDRLDRDSGQRHGPARALEDTLAVGEGDQGSRLLWEMHRARAEKAIASLRLTAPRPGMVRRDPFALRAAGIVVVAASAIVAGPEIGDRLGAAFDWRDPVVAAPTFRVDGWIDPPLYTRSPPLMIDLASGQQKLRAPIQSVVVVRVAGVGEAKVTPESGLEALPETKNARADLREQRFTLTGDAALSVDTGFTGGTRLTIEAIPDRPPTIALIGQPEIAARGMLGVTYKGSDDYGIVSVEGMMSKAEGLVGRRTLVPAPTLPLPAPDMQGEAESKSVVDLTTHAWAGAKVKLFLLAKDEAGQEGRSETVEFTLPSRTFTKPLAKALVEQRRKLVLDPDDRRRVQVALDSLLIEPSRFTPQWGVYLGLRSATERLRRARVDNDLVEIADWLWTMAVQIEDGDLSDAERELKAAQERLREAMDRNAPDEEIAKLMEELRTAMDKFLREFAERMQREQNQADRNDQNNQQQSDRTISQDDLNRMLNEMQEAMKRGDVAQAQRLLDQLKNILENLQTARPNSRTSDPMAREMNRSMEELEGMIRDQQQLRDETFRQGQERRMQRGDRGQQQGQRGQRGQRQQGQRGQQGEQGENGEGQEQAEGQGQGQQGGQGLSERQQALRDRLRELQRRMRGMGMQGEQGLSDADGAMGDAQGALGQGGREGEAVDSQGRALEGLQRGMQGMAQQMQDMMGQGDGTEQAGDQPGQGQPGQRGTAQRDTDPLGRPVRSRDLSDNSRVRVPNADESAVERARRILEEVRRKLGDPTRPREELEYLERLLRRN
jgi:uncharacterized protein (TIGR02302 family)